MIDNSNSILANVKLIQNVFLQARAFAEKSNSVIDVFNYINDLSGDYISVACEGASMAFAIKSLESNDHLFLWKQFCEKFENNHDVQIYIGLGWALAQKKLSPESILDFIDKGLSWRIFDGYGYYEAVFRKRKVNQLVFPDSFNSDELKVYFQGVGRSLWYETKGDVNSLSNRIEFFPEKYHPDLWRGIGIASVYVGSADTEIWKNLKIAAKKNYSYLFSGGCLAIGSRVKANTQNQSCYSICQLWYRMNFNEFVSRLSEAESLFDSGKEFDYLNWIDFLDSSTLT